MDKLYPHKFIRKFNAFSGLLIASSLFLLVANQNLWGQAASATWAGTANANAAIVGNVTAGAATKGPNVTSSLSFNGTYGLNATPFSPNTWLSFAVTDAANYGNYYFQYTITPTAGYNLSVTSISFLPNETHVGADGFTYYSTNNFATYTLLDIDLNTPWGTGSTMTYSGLNISVPNGTTLTIRVYTMDMSSPSYPFYCKNFVISGTTAVACVASVAPTGLSISNNPTCAGGATTLTPTGGTLGTGATWKYYTGGCGTTLAGSGNSLAVSPASTTQYWVRAEGGGCSATTACANNTLNVNAVPSSGALTPSPATGAICAGTNVSATATAGAGGAGTITDVLQYRYDGGAWNAYTSGNALTTTGHTSVDIQTYRTATGSGCTTSATVTDSWTINAVPTITGTTPGSNCGTGTVTLGATASAGTINWYANSTGGTSLGTGTSFTTPSISTTTTYYVDATSSGCTTASRTAVTATINSVPANPGTPTDNGPQCVANGVTYTRSGSPPVGETWYWQGTSCGTNTGLGSGATYVVYSSGIHYIRSQNNASGCWSAGCGHDASGVTVQPAPTITSQPSNQTVCPSVNANFTVATSAGSPSYQWQMSANGSTGWVNVANGTPAGVTYTNGTTATLTANGTSAVAAYYYMCVVTAATCSANSNVATLIINAPPSITTQPSTTGQSGGTGFSATAYSVTASGAGLTYQWYSNAVNSNSGGTLLVGATSSSYTPVTTVVGTLYYYCIVSGTCSPSVTSNVSGAVTVNPIPAAPTVAAATNTDCKSFFANWSSSSGATTYYLDVSTVNNFASFVTGYNNLNTGLVTTYFVSGLSASTTYYYRVRAYNSNGTSGNSTTQNVTTTASCSGNLGVWQQVGGGSAGGIDAGDGPGDWEVSAMCSDGANHLYIGGAFTQVNNASSVAAACIAKWTPSATYPNTSGTWSNIGNIAGGTKPQSGDNISEVFAMAYSNGVLYVGGNFTTVNGSATDGAGKSYKNLAKYTVASSTWSAIGGGGVSGGSMVGLAENYGANTYGGGYPVQALAVDASGNLYVGGNFTTVAGTSGFNNIAMWNGTTWSNLGGGMTGSNTNPNDVWDGTCSCFISHGGFTVWALGSTSPSVYALDVVDATHVYAGGQFSSPASNIAMWNGSSWSALGAGIPQTAFFDGSCSGTEYAFAFSLCPVVLAIANNGSLVYAGGVFNQAGGVSTDNIAQWNQGTASWSSIGGVCGPSVQEGEVAALNVTNGILYVGGDFQIANGITINEIGEYDGWVPMPSTNPGIEAGAGNVLSIATLSFGSGYGIVYTGGDFDNTQAGSSVNSVAQFAGIQALPISLIDFSGMYVAKEKAVDLFWHTATEQNCDYFAVERSLDGKNWNEIGKVNGSGNSNTEKSYGFVDSELPITNATITLYYRLKPTDFNGQYEYYGPVSIQLAPIENWKLVIKNPATDNNLTGTLFTTEDGNVSLQIMDLQGRIIKTENINAVKGSNLLNIDISNLDRGLYLVKTYNNTNNILSKFVKL